MVVESPYVDRHYLEEFSGYYATALRPPPAKAVRIHVFSLEITDSDFEEIVRSAAAGAYDQERSRLQAGYLGFVVVRPIPSVAIGRTILRPYDDKPGRNYGPPAKAHHVHLAGLELEVEGVPFQQQDQAVGACATTAVWSSLARVIRTDGGRAPTPLGVTTAANKNLLSGRPFPASAGLELAQMLAAIREFGSSPHVLKPDEEPAVFHLAVKTYVASGIPVILQIKPSDGELHAIALTGFWSDPKAKPVSVDISDSWELLALPMSKVYVHDDRFGPYARMTLDGWSTPPQKSKAVSYPGVVGAPYEAGFEQFAQMSKVWTAIVPLYPKIRLSAEDLLRVATQALPLMASLAGTAERSRLRVEMSFALSGRYLRSLLGIGLAPDRAATIARSASLPRYVAVVRYRVGEEWFADVVCDTTEIFRPTNPWAPVITLICRNDAQVQTLRKVPETYGFDALVS
jgi:hypothetical protein